MGISGSWGRLLWNTSSSVAFKCQQRKETGGSVVSDLIAQAVLLAIQVLAFLFIAKPWLLRQLHIIGGLADAIRQIVAVLR